METELNQSLKDALCKLQNLTEEEKEKLRAECRKFSEAHQERIRQEKIDKILWWNKVKDIPLM